ncbi:putative uncharacterized protein DDB_G0282499 [Ruditapes philippinarum]|uniref:putative uncharacterized protein DDB_G0282499 n=1 Tax=Ruditapes philippinarum TaxID=129788 RepID=UPI00295B0F5A|nr:putative uncharacterized protein DDB_G0282499 [Ruditapes philippinarum]
MPKKKPYKAIIDKKSKRTKTPNNNNTPPTGDIDDREHCEQYLFSERLYSNKNNMNVATETNEMNNQSPENSITKQLSQARETLYPTTTNNQQEVNDRQSPQMDANTTNIQSQSNNYNDFPQNTMNNNSDFSYMMYPPFPPFVMPPMQPRMQTQPRNQTQAHTGAPGYNNEIPHWLAGILQDINKKLDIKLNSIESKLEKQSEEWRITNHTLKAQNDRLAKVEAQQSDMKGLSNNLKQSILSNSMKVSSINTELSDIHKEIEAGLNAVEYSEGAVKCFMKEKLNIKKNIKIDKAYRLGKRSVYQIQPRPIVIKLMSLKDKEYIQHMAYDKLKETQYAVREQYPREIQERRKPLYQELKKAKENGDKVKLVRDKLYINNERFHPNTETRNRRRPDNENRQSRPKYNSNVNNPQNARYRMVYNSRMKDPITEIPLVPTPISNRFDCLDSCTPLNDPIRKKPDKRSASQRSPLDAEPYPKKYRDINVSESDTIQESKLDDLDRVNIEGYNIYMSNREKTSKNRSGGTAYIISQTIEPSVEILDVTSKLVQWLKLTCKIEDNVRELYIGNVYIPPIGTKYENPDPFLEIQGEIDKYDKENILLMGDFNSRTGDKDDFIVCDEYIFGMFCNNELFIDYKN